MSKFFTGIPSGTSLIFRLAVFRTPAVVQVKQICFVVISIKHDCMTGDRTCNRCAIFHIFNQNLNGFIGQLQVVEFLVLSYPERSFCVVHFVKAYLVGTFKSGSQERFCRKNGSGSPNRGISGFEHNSNREIQGGNVLCCFKRIQIVITGSRSCRYGDKGGKFAIDFRKGQSLAIPAAIGRNIYCRFRDISMTDISILLCEYIQFELIAKIILKIIQQMIVNYLRCCGSSTAGVGVIFRKILVKRCILIVIDPVFQILIISA